FQCFQHSLCRTAAQGEPFDVGGSVKVFEGHAFPQRNFANRRCLPLPRRRRRTRPGVVGPPRIAEERLTRAPIRPTAGAAGRRPDSLTPGRLQEVERPTFCRMAPTWQATCAMAPVTAPRPYSIGRFKKKLQAWAISWKLHGRLNSAADCSVENASGVLARFGFFEFFGEGRDNLEYIADDAVVGHFEDGSVGVLVDGHNRARALHPDHVLACAADAQRQVELWRNSLAGAADLALQRQPAYIANRPRCRQLPA